MMSNDQTLVVIRHGILSSTTAMEKIEARLKETLPGCTIDNEDYDWEEYVLHSGIALAGHVLDLLAQSPKLRKVIFVGHSQGGLVCRVAVATLCARTDLLAALLAPAMLGDAYYKLAEDALKSLVARHAARLDAARDAMHSVVMLGTPNAGAISNGQLAIEAGLFMRAARRIGNRLKWRNFDELSTDRLFTILQHVRVHHVRYVSVSGSSVNRYSTGTMQVLKSIPVLSRLAPSLDLPNDGVVEDTSVDLREAPLPPEIADLERQYRHVRSYSECIRVSHVTVHSDRNVFEALDNVPGWK